MTAIVPQPATISNQQFLQGIFGQAFNMAHVTGFIEDPGKLDQLDLRHYWGGNVWCYNILEDPSYNNFFTISTFNQDPDGTHRRRKNNFSGAYCIMIDDIGDGPGAKIGEFQMTILGPAPSWRLLTSPGNYQYGYIFDEPEADRWKVEALLKGLVSLDLVDGGGDPGMLGSTRYARLPVGSNTKEKYGFAFRHQLVEWMPTRMYSPDRLARDFGIKLVNHKQEDHFPDALPLDQDLVYQSLDRLGMIKGKLRDDVYDIVCPWVSHHTEELDNGTAYLAPTGMKCHHGGCATRTGRDLLNYLHGADPEYKEACRKAMPFQPLGDEPIEAKFTVIEDEITPDEAEFLKNFGDALHRIEPGNPRSADAAYRTFAMYLPKLSPEEKDIYLRQIKDASAVTLKVVRDQLKYTRAALLREHRDRGILNEPAWKQIKEDKIVGCKENFEALCDYSGITFKYNQMSHRIDSDVPGQDFSDENADNLLLTHMKDEVQISGIPYARVDEWMVSMSHDNEFHPFRAYLDKLATSKAVVKSDCPMFYKMLDTLDVTNNKDEAEEFVRRWFISVVAAVRGHGGAGMKGVLTFAGAQGIGKTSWFRELFPDSMFCEGLVLDPHNKDTLIKATNHLICELGELDATFKKDIPALKAFISSQSDEIRQPYAAKTSNYPRRTVFCATVNQTNFLVDQTGNSRFWPIDVDDCNFMAVKEMRETGELDMMWREIDMMYHACVEGGRSEFKWWIAADENGLLNSASERFIKESAGESMLRDVYNMDDLSQTNWMTAAEICQDLGLRMTDNNYVPRKNEVLESLRRITGQRLIQKFTRDGERLSGYQVPARKVKKMVQLRVVSTEFDFL